MRPESTWHGCLILLLAVGIDGILGTTTQGQEPVRGQSPVGVQSRMFDIEYTVNDAALPLDSVQLWYTLDRGASWHQYGLDEDRQSPFSFHAPAEGLYGFFLTVANATGPSSGPPTRETQPHRWAFVDYTPPVVQLHALQFTTIVGQRALQIRWTAIDPHLVSRPVAVSYQRLPDGPWQTVTPDPLANTGRFDWRLPDDLVGPVAVRVAVRDKGGHRVESEPQVSELPAVRSARPLPGVADGIVAAASGTSRRVTETARARAARLLAEGRRDRQRGEIRQAIARMREAVKVDPSNTDAFAEMGTMLYRMGDLDRALDAYGIALEQRPTLRSALQGAAMVYRQKSHYPKAAELLQTILRYNPNDAEVWMNLGDIAVFQGDDVRARECYQRASQIDPTATQVIEEAGKRLDLMTQVARTYGRIGQ